MRWVLSLVIILTSQLSWAEYRVFLLEIRHVDRGTSRQVLSTLDQYQYPDYHPLSPRELVVLQDHWMCYGRTVGYEPPCPSPRDTPRALGAPEIRQPAAADPL